MQTDVKSKRVTASGAIFAEACRIKGYSVLGAGTVDFKDGGSGGTIVLTADSVATPVTVCQLPGEGILCRTSLYTTLTGVTSITVFYG